MPAGLQFDKNDYSGAIASFNQASHAGDKSLFLLTWRGAAYARVGQPALARQDFAAARPQARIGTDFNNICWSEATNNIDLALALRDCNAAVKLAPNDAAILDSRGFVLLRLGRFAQSLTSYTAALGLRPKQADSLLGRAIARKKLGDRDGSRTDLAAAVALDSGVVARFAGYGVTM